MKWRKAGDQDLQLLGEMNHRLIEDEGHRNPMSVVQLVDRMQAFLRGDYTAIIFENESETLGYALFHPQEDDLYLRQFFIERNHRRSGRGRAAARLLLNEIFPGNKRVVVSVLATNPTALDFWRAVGFDDYCVTLEIFPTRTPN